MQNIKIILWLKLHSTSVSLLLGTYYIGRRLALNPQDGYRDLFRVFVAEMGFHFTLRVRTVLAVLALEQPEVVFVLEVLQQTQGSQHHHKY